MNRDSGQCEAAVHRRYFSLDQGRWLLQCRLPPLLGILVKELETDKQGLKEHCTSIKKKQINEREHGRFRPAEKERASGQDTRHEQSSACTANEISRPLIRQI